MLYFHPLPHKTAGSASVTSIGSTGVAIWVVIPPEAESWVSVDDLEIYAMDF